MKGEKNIYKKNQQYKHYKERTRRRNKEGVSRKICKRKI